jgi:hypothetical protein
LRIELSPLENRHTFHTARLKFKGSFSVIGRGYKKSRKIRNLGVGGRVDLNQCWGSGSVGFWATWIRIR